MLGTAARPNTSSSYTYGTGRFPDRQGAYRLAGHAEEAVEGTGYQAWN